MYIDATDKFIYVVIVIGIIFVTTRIGSYGLVTGVGVFGLLVGIVVVYYLNDRRERQGTGFVTTMNTILDSEIMKPAQYLYLSSELTIFLDNHREYYQYNPSLWRVFVRHIDNFLHVAHDIELGTEQYNYDYTQLKETKRKILNSYQAFIHTIPHTESSNNKFHEGMKVLEQLLNKELDQTHRLVAQKNSEGVNTASMFHYKNHPAGYEQMNSTENTYTFFTA